MTISNVIATFAELLILTIVIRAILSWLSDVSALRPVAHFVNTLTNPLIEPIRRRLPPVGGIDWSPLVTIVLIWLVENLLLVLLAGR